MNSSRRLISPLSVEELGQLTPQQLANLLAQIVLLLRRFPDVPLVEFAKLEEAKTTGEEV
jgi:hypothetical protein